MALAARLGGLAAALRLSSRQLAGQQGAAFHLSAAVEARRRREESDSDSDAEGPNPSPRAAPSTPEDAAEEFPPRIDQSQLRDDDGKVPQEPMARLVAVNDGRWDIATLVSPALAAALEAAPAPSEAAIEKNVQQLHDALQALEKGQRLKGDSEASEEDLLRVAEAIDLYFQAAPVTDPEADGFEDIDRELLWALSETIKEVLGGGARSTVVNTAPPGRLPWEVLEVDESKPMVSWGVDLTEGKAQDPWKNALLSEEAKAAMWEMHQEGWSAEDLAAHFGIRQQRALAILALKEREAAAAAGGRPLADDVAAGFEEEYGAHEVVGARERHHVVLPSFPNYKELTEADADRLAALLEARLGKRFEDIGLEDVTPEVAHELLAAAGASKAALEEELAAKEEAALVAEFRGRLQYNLGKVGTSLSRRSRKTHPPKRPDAGWSLLVQPLGKAAAAGGGKSAYVAAPDGSWRELTEDEALMVERQRPRPMYKVA